MARVKRRDRYPHWPLLAFIPVLVLCACSGGGSSSSAERSSSTPTAAISGPATPLESSGPIDLSSLAGEITFSGGPPHGEDVYVVNADGTGLRRVTSDAAADFDPSWAPDGLRIVYRHQPGDDLSTDLYTIGSDGSAADDLTSSAGVPDWGPAWSPDGGEIAWNSDPEGRGVLHGYLMRPDGSGVRPLGADVWVEYPAWSPDGERLAFMGQTPVGGENYEVYVVDRDGGGLRRLTDSPGSDGWPAWAPDGRHILFSSVRDDCAFSAASDCRTTGDLGPYHTLYVMRADGSQERRVSLTYGQIADWSPDGRYIVFEGRTGLSILRANGSGLTTLHTNVPSSGFPDWRQ
jgi:Tol biopolymer transport system component